MNNYAGQPSSFFSTTGGKPVTGAWYSGRQAWQDTGGNWTLSDPGQINPLSNQQGAGQAVSNEVITQTNPANVAYIQAQRQASGLAPSVTPSSTPTTPSTPVSQTVAPVTTPAINLPSTYSNLYATSGIGDLEKQYNDYTAQYTEAKAKINDNPFLSEATRVGRVAKIEALYQDRTANLLNQIEQKKSDINNQLSISQKQYEYETSASQNAQELALKQQQAGKANTQTIQSTDDNGNVTVTIINSDTGEIVSQKSIGQVEKVTKKTGTSSSESTSAQKSNAQIAIMSYITDTNAQASLSPEEYIMLLMQKYPNAGITIDDAEKIRNKTGQGITKP